jgi:hypothetical protein
VAEACLRAALGVLVVVAIVVVFGTELPTRNPLADAAAGAEPTESAEPSPSPPSPTGVALSTADADSPPITSIGSPTVARPSPSATTRAAGGPTCGLGDSFKTLVQAVGEGTVGRCLEDEYVNLLEGDTHQRTTRGVLVWRKASGVAMFTDGTTSWYGCPRVVVRRPSREPWPC